MSRAMTDSDFLDHLKEIRQAQRDHAVQNAKDHEALGQRIAEVRDEDREMHRSLDVTLRAAQEDRSELRRIANHLHDVVIGNGHPGHRQRIEMCEDWVLGQKRFAKYFLGMMSAVLTAVLIFVAQEWIKSSREAQQALDLQRVLEALESKE